MLSISKNRCVGCGICVDDCPAHAISINENGVAVIDRSKCIECGKCIEVCPQSAIKDIKEKLLFAIGTDDGETIKQDDHVGMSKYFLVYEYNNGNITFKEKRENPKYVEDETRIHGDPEKAKKVASVLDDIDVIAGKRLGPNIVGLRNKFVPVIIRELSIEKALEIIKENINEIIDEKNKKERTGIILK